MGGDVYLESEPGKGSEFTARMRQGKGCGGVIGEAGARSLKTFTYTAGKRGLRASFARVQLPGARVLVVDDMAANLDVTRGMLKPYGMKVDCVTSGREAVNVIRAGRVRYDAVFLDHMMPEMDGIETARAIRAVNGERAKSVPLIALTANAASGAERMFLEKGFQAFVSKPIDPVKLDAVIRRLIRAAGTEGGK
jgi:CheY-like chemotaxis protein